MSIEQQLLKQVRRAVAQATGAVADPELRGLLVGADVALNTLQQRRAGDFYRRYIDQGQQLLARGRALAPSAATEEPHLADAADVDSAVAALHRQLSQLVAAVDDSRSAEARDWLIAVTDWETGFYEHYREPAPFEAVTGEQRITQASLQQYLRRKFPQHANLVVTNFQPLVGGFSKQTILFETSVPLQGHASLVLRAQQKIDLLGCAGSQVDREYPMIEQMRRAGLPIAQVLWLEPDPQHLGAKFIVSCKAAGKSVGGNLGSTEKLSSALIDHVVDTMIQMHQMRIDRTDAAWRRSHLEEWLGCHTVRDTATYCAQHFLPALVETTRIGPSPSLVRALRWLKQNVPDCADPAAVVHLDFALNNLVVDGDRVTAVLDWESSRLGDPADDIIWTQQNLSAYLSMDELLRRHRAATGRRISAYRLAYARVSRCAQNAITCQNGLRMLEQDDFAHLKLAVLGYQYMAIFGSQFNSLIAAADQARNSVS